MLQNSIYNIYLPGYIIYNVHGHASTHFNENLKNGLKFYSLNFNGILHVSDRI